MYVRAKSVGNVQIPIVMKMHAAATMRRHISFALVLLLCSTAISSAASASCALSLAQRSFFSWVLLLMGTSSSSGGAGKVLRAGCRAVHPSAVGWRDSETVGVAAASFTAVVVAAVSACAAVAAAAGTACAASVKSAI